MDMIDFEKAKKMIGCEKFVVVEGEVKERISLDQTFPMNCRLELTTNEADISFIWDIKQSTKNTIRLSLHCMDEDSKLGLIRVDYNAGHINPETATDVLPECFKPYIAKKFADNEHHVHYHVPGYKQLAWALPIEDTPLKVKSVSIETLESDIIDAIYSFAETINLKTTILINPILL